MDYFLLCFLLLFICNWLNLLTVFWVLLIPIITLLALTAAWANEIPVITAALIETSLAISSALSPWMAPLVVCTKELLIANFEEVIAAWENVFPIAPRVPFAPAEAKLTKLLCLLELLPWLFEILPLNLLLK